MKRPHAEILFIFLGLLLTTSPALASENKSKPKDDDGWTISDTFEDEDTAAEEEKAAFQSKFKEDSDDTYEDGSADRNGEAEDSMESGEDGDEKEK